MDHAAIMAKLPCAATHEAKPVHIDAKFPPPTVFIHSVEIVARRKNRGDCH
jgi:hypothetical protein